MAPSKSSIITAKFDVVDLIPGDPGNWKLCSYRYYPDQYFNGTNRDYFVQRDVILADFSTLFFSPWNLFPGI